VNTLQPITLTGPALGTIAQPGSVVSATATLEIRGSSDQAYSVSLSPAAADAGAVTVEDLAAWSENARWNLGEGSPGRTNAAGRDIVHLTGNILLPQEVTSDGETASMTLGLDYQ
jgi:hypothetical protein